MLAVRSLSGLELKEIWILALNHAILRILLAFQIRLSNRAAT
jgi:hypothetical protein